MLVVLAPHHSADTLVYNNYASAATEQDKHGVAYKGMASTFKRVAAEEGGKVSCNCHFETVNHVTVVAPCVLDRARRLCVLCNSCDGLPAVFDGVALGLLQYCIASAEISSSNTYSSKQDIRR
eukprot:2139-Heterococcus_DN1.PRE.1